MKTDKSKLDGGDLKETRRFLEVVGRLRKECPWDKKQTHKSLIPYLIEEAYEAVDAIEEQSGDKMREELGDVLLQIALHSEIAGEKGTFSFESIAHSIAEKMIRRHPHIFAEADIKTAEDQTKNWSKLKEKENPNRSLLAGIPKAMPGLSVAQRYGEIAASVNFDWPNAEKVMEKVDEELDELKVEMKRKKRIQKDMEMELGDLLFTITRLAAHLKIDSERALKRSCAKFEERFGRLETEFKKKKKAMGDSSLKELDAVWNQVKKKKTKAE